MNDENNGYPSTITPEPNKHIKKNHTKKAAAVCVSAAALLVMFFGGSFLVKSARDNESHLSLQASAGSTANKSNPDNILPLLSQQYQRYDAVEVVKYVSRSVVSINVTSRDRSTPYLSESLSGSGSGIIIDEDDENIYIATNHHVIQGAVRLSVSMDNINNAPAYHIGSDTQSDLAVISVNKDALEDAGINGYAIATLGSSTDLEVGEYVVAIGNALGEGQTVTDGIISAKSKEINIGNIKLTVLQTNAAINQGNSGGPLANMYGEIIGINTAKLSMEGVEGMGYSIPINDARDVIGNIMSNPNQPAADISNDSNTAPRLGIQGITVTYEMMNQYNFPAQGVYVADTLENSTARNAGIQSGDIIVAFESKKITTIEELTAEIQKCDNGGAVKIYVYREGSTTPVRLNAAMQP